ncbi:MAG: hypothetical protein R3C51_03570 [Parvularculaceae bacterium]
MNFTVEAMVAAAVMVIFFIQSLFTLKERHRDVEAWHVHVGAAIYGLIFGGVIGFVIVPMRALLMDGSLPPQVAAYSGFGVLGVMLALRTGFIARLPFVGPQVRSYRRASLRRVIERSNKQLNQLTSKSASINQE